jgi:two-component system chemotaxis response regulator CheY
LIVEDDPASRMLLTEWLQEWGECDMATNGQEAMNRMAEASQKKKPYDLICLDIMMPQMDGHEVLKRIREAEKKEGVLLGDGVKALMITALGDSKNVMSSFKEECDGYLVKPVTRENLLKEIKKFGFA